MQSALIPNPHILIVDDDVSMARSFEIMFRVAKKAVRLTRAYTPDTARQTIRQILDDPTDELDLILLDIMMPAPQSFGLDLLDWIRGQSQLDSTQVLMLTTLRDEHTINQSLRAGANDYLMKDSSQLEMLARIDTALRARAGEMALVRSYEQVQALVDGVGQSIYAVNDAYEVVLENQGQVVQTAGSTVCYERFFGRPSPCVHCQLKTIFQGQTNVDWKWVDDQDKSPLGRHWEVSAFRLPKRVGNEDAWAVVVWQDRTQQNMLQASLLRAEKLAAVGELAAGLAHEINNPLSVILTGADLLGDKAAMDKEAKEMVEMVGVSAERASKTVTELLDFARPSVFDFKQGNLAESLENAISFMAYRFRKAGVTVTTHFPNYTPEIVASWSHLQTVWVNLLFNAQDALKGNQTDKIIHVAIPEVSSRHVQVLFQDNGIGISEKDISHIFDPFYTTKSPGEGTGLGLSMTHQLIEKHNGTIQVHSLPRIQTSFLIRLPIDGPDNFVGS